MSICAVAKVWIHPCAEKDVLVDGELKLDSRVDDRENAEEADGV